MPGYFECTAVNCTYHLDRAIVAAPPAEATVSTSSQGVASEASTSNQGVASEALSFNTTNSTSNASVAKPPTGSATSPSADRKIEEPDVRQCWVCYVNEEELPHAVWLRPCRCRGTLRWVHDRCLQRFIDERIAQGYVDQQQQQAQAAAARMGPLHVDMQVDIQEFPPAPQPPLALPLANLPRAPLAFPPLPRPNNLPGAAPGPGAALVAAPAAAAPAQNNNNNILGALGGAAAAGAAAAGGGQPRQQRPVVVSCPQCHMPYRIVYPPLGNQLNFYSACCFRLAHPYNCNHLNFIILENANVILCHFIMLSHVDRRKFLSVHLYSTRLYARARTVGPLARLLETLGNRTTTLAPYMVMSAGAFAIAWCLLSHGALSYIQVRTLDTAYCIVYRDTVLDKKARVFDLLR